MKSLLIGVAGPYSAPTESERSANVEALNEASRLLLQRGHIPLVGVHAALPIVASLPEAERYDAIMRISLALIDRCDALLVIGSSPGADWERKLIEASGKTVYTRIEDIPSAER